MARRKRIFHEWQHPRDGRGRFTDGAGTASWADRAEKAFKAATPAVAAGSGSAPGRPRIGRAAKGEALFAAHREGARPSAVRAPKAATITPAPPVKNLAAFNAPDKLPTRRRPSTFELGPKSKSASGPDAPSVKKMAPPKATPAKKAAAGPQRDFTGAQFGGGSKEGFAFLRANEAAHAQREKERGGPKPLKFKGAQMTEAERTAKLNEAQNREAATPARGNAGFQAIADRAPTAAERGLDTPRANGKAGGMTPTTVTPELSDEQRGNYDKLLGNGPSEGLVKHKQSRQIVEQMEQHGWIMNGNAPAVGLLSFKAPDGREIGVQFLVGEYSSKPRFFTRSAARGRDISYKAALAHVVTPTHEEAGGGSVSGALKRLGMPRIDESHSDYTLKPLRDAQQAHTGYGTMHGPTKNTAEVAADLRKAAEHNRSMADHRAGYNRGFMSGDGEDENSRLLRQRADQFEAVANDMESADTARKAFEVERERRAGLPLDIRPTPRSGPAKPARAESATGVDRVMKARSDVEAGRAFAELSPQEIVDAFERDPAKALRGYIVKNFGKDTRYQRQGDFLKTAQANLASGTWDREQAARSIEQHTRLTRGMEYHSKQQLAADLLNGEAGKRLAKRTSTPETSKPAMRQASDSIAAQRGLPDTSGPGDIMGDEPSQMDVIKGMAKDVAATEAPTAGVGGPGGYAGMKRHTIVSLARTAGIDIRGKSNSRLAEELDAKDAATKAERAARLNPSGVGTGGHDTRYDSMDIREVDSILAGAGINTAGMSRDQKLAALAARDSRIGVQRFPEVAPGDVRSGPGGNFERTGINGRNEGVRRPKGETVGSAVRGDRSPRQMMAEHAGLTRAQFDALPADERERVLTDLRAVRDSGDTKTIPSNRTAMGTTIRGATADHVHAAQVKIAELVRAKVDPADYTTAGRARRAAAGDTGAITGTMAELQEIASANKWGYIASWDKRKATDQLRDFAAAHDVLPASWTTEGVADALALPGADQRKALAVLDIMDRSNGLTLANLDAIARHLGVPKPAGRDKRTKMHDLAGKAGAARPKGEAAPGAASGDPAMTRLSDERLRQGLQMYGTDTPNGRKVVAEMQRRGLNPNDEPRRGEPAGVDTSRVKPHAGGAANTTTEANVSKPQNWEDVKPGDIITIPVRTVAGRDTGKTRQVKVDTVSGPDPLNPGNGYRTVEGATVGERTRGTKTRAFIPLGDIREHQAAGTAGASPREAVLGVTESSRGRTTTVTLPDGTTAQRTSKSMAYTHAVVVTTDHRGQARDLRSDADRSDAYVKALRQWIADGEDFSKLKHYKTGTGEMGPNHNRRKTVEGYLPGFEPVEKPYTARGLQGKTYLADEGSFGIPDPNDPYNNSDEHRRIHEGTAYERWGPADRIKTHVNRIARERAQADKLDAGPAESYSVWRWSQSLPNAMKGQSEFSRVRHTRTQIVGVGGAARELPKPTKVVPTAEEKAAAKAATAAAAKQRQADSDAAFVARTRQDVERAIAEGRDPEDALKTMSEQGLRFVVRAVGAKIPRQPRDDYGRSQPLDRDAARKAIVAAIRAPVGPGPVPLGATDADRAHIRPRIEGESDLGYSLRTAPSDFAAEQILAGHSVAGLRAIARDEKVSVASKATKPQLIEALLMRRRRFHDAEAIYRMGREGMTRTQAPEHVSAATVTPPRTNTPAGPAPAATLTGSQLLAQRRAARG